MSHIVFAGRVQAPANHEGCPPSNGSAIVNTTNLNNKTRLLLLLRQFQQFVSNDASQCPEKGLGFSLPQPTDA